MYLHCRICVDALLQLLGARPLPSGLPRSLLNKQMPEVAITPQQLGEMSEVIAHALKEITDNLKPSNR